MHSGAVYLSGLVLAGRAVLVVGGGRVATRRIGPLLASGARVHVVAPEATEALSSLADTGQLRWSARTFEAVDLDDAWYVLALTDDPATNAEVASLAEQRHIFCVRGDAAEGGTAWTPATGIVDGLHLAVVTSAGPRAAVAARDVAVAALRSTLPQDASHEGVVAPSASDGSRYADPAPAGWVTLVGGGPGDPGLLTVAGLAAVRAADTVLYDRLVPMSTLAAARAEAELIDVGKVPRGEFTPQETINALLIEHACAGRRVVRLKGGDPFVFGRGGEEAEACAAAGVPVRVIPGVTSAVAAPALAGVPVTHRALSQGFAVVSGHVPPGDPRSQVDWAALARSNVTLVILMGVKNLAEICRTLTAAGLAAETPAAVTMNAGLPSMLTVHGHVGTIAERATAAQIDSPAVTVIGEVAGIGLGLR